MLSMPLPIARVGTCVIRQWPVLAWAHTFQLNKLTAP